MIGTDKYEETDHPELVEFEGETLGDTLTNLLAEVLRLREAWRILRSKTEMSCVCFTEYPDKQDMNTHELMDLAMKEASE